MFHVSLVEADDELLRPQRGGVMEPGGQAEANGEQESFSFPSSTQHAAVDC